MATPRHCPPTRPHPAFCAVQSKRLAGLALWLGLGTTTFSTASVLATPVSDPRAAAPGSPEQKVLEAYYGNTLVCAAAVTRQDICHTWMERDGTFINFDPAGVRHGRFTIGPMRPDGKVPVCYYWDQANIPLPPELEATAPRWPPGHDVTVCETRNYRTRCASKPAAAVPPALAAETFLQGMARRWHDGMCYPLAAKKVGDVWDEPDDPLPAQGSVDRVYLVEGHR